MARHYYRLNIILFVVAIVAQLFTAFTNFPLGLLAPVLAIIARLTAINYLYKAGRMVQTWWRSGAYFALVLILLGILARIQHWPAANILLTIPLLGFPLYYSIWFFLKRGKDRSDYFKVLWVILAFSISWLAGMRFPDSMISGWLLLACDVLLYITYMIFIEEEHEQRRFRNWLRDFLRKE